MDNFLTKETIVELQTLIVESLTTYGFKIVAAVAAWFIGLFIIKKIAKVIGFSFQRVEIDPALESFLQSFISVALKVILLIVTVSILGVQTSSFVALLGAAGLAVGLALQGSLANFAGGALILFFKPFTVGDRIETSAHTGVVEKIQILYTVLRDRNNRRIVIPNGELSNNSIISYFGNSHFGIEIIFGISYSDDIDKAKNIIKKVISNNTHVLQDPEPVIAVSELADSSVNILTRSFVSDSEQYWAVRFDLIEQIKKEFDISGISIPFPQRDVHMYNHN